MLLEASRGQPAPSPGDVDCGPTQDLAQENTTHHEEQQSLHQQEQQAVLSPTVATQPSQESSQDSGAMGLATQ